MRYGIEVRIGSHWEPVRPPTAPPYEFKTKEEAEAMAEVLFREIYPDPEVLRVIPTNKEAS